METALASSVSTKLQDIASQIEALQAKARLVVEDALCAVELHKAKYEKATFYNYDTLHFLVNDIH